MNDEIKEILYLEKYIDKYKSDEKSIINGNRLTTPAMLDYLEVKNLLEYITNLQKENERLKEQNNDLRKIYRNTYQRLFNNGNDELARYFQAQIDDCPTFYVEPIIDYHKEWKDYKSRIDKALKHLESLQERYNNYASKEQNLYIFESVLNGVSEIISIKYILNGGDENDN